MPPNPALLPLAALVLLLLWVCLTDVRYRLITNRTVIAIALLALPYWLLRGMTAEEAWRQVAVVAAATVFFGLLWQAGHWLGRRLIGGGDVKLLIALALWLPPIAYLNMLLVMSLVGALLAIVVLAANRDRQARLTARVPYGVAIAAGALTALGEPIVKQFAA